MKLFNLKIKHNNKYIILELLKYEESDKIFIKQIYKRWVILNSRLKNQLNASRGINFPEGLSEPIACLDLKLAKLVSVKGANYSSSFDCFDKKNNQRIQIKCSSSDGPTQFGPRSVQDVYYFVDFFSEKKINGKYKIYKITNEQIRNSKVNKNETVLQKAERTGQRPRFSIRSKIVIPLNLKPVFEGDLLN
jgi:hypothetical protein